MISLKNPGKGDLLLNPCTRRLIEDLKACSRSRNLTTGRKLHQESIKTGADSNLLVASSLVKMYSSCRSLQDALKAFIKIQTPDVVLWNSIIFACVENGDGEQALELFFSMQKKSFQFNNLTLIAALKACSIVASNGEIDLALETGLRIDSLSKNQDLFLISSLVDMYSKCRSLENALGAFKRVSSEAIDICLCNSLVMAFSENDQGHSALEIFSHLCSRFDPNPRTYIAAFKACSSIASQESGSKMRALEIGMALHSRALSTSCYCSSDTFVGNSLMDMYVKSGSVSDAQMVFDRIHRPDVVSWNILISGHVSNGDHHLALEIFTLLKSRGPESSPLTYVAALKACAGLEAQRNNQNLLEIGMALHSSAIESGFESNKLVSSSLIEVYSRCRSLADARILFDRIQEKNLVAWNLILSAYVENDEAQEALDLFQAMISSGFHPDSRSYVAALKACSALASSERLGEIDGKFFRVLSLERGMFLHRRVLESGMKNNEGFLESTLIDVYSKCGSMQDAVRVFIAMKNPDLVPTTALLLGYVDNGEHEEALRFFYSRSEIQNDVTTLGAALRACGSSKVKYLEIGKDLHSKLCRCGLESEPGIVTLLTELYGRHGSKTLAQLVFDSVAARERSDVITWTSLIAAYNRAGDSSRSLEVFERFIEEGLEPNPAMFARVLGICSRVAMVEKGKRYFEEMREKYGIQPGAEHFQSMVDLLASGGFLDEAVEFIEGMPVEASVINWMSVLGACHKLGKSLKVAKRAFDEVLLLDDKQQTAYVLMANILKLFNIRKI